MFPILRVLAVADPAVYAYTDQRYRIIGTFNEVKNTMVDFKIVPWAEYYPRMIEALEGKADFDIVMAAGHLWPKDFATKGYIDEVAFPDTPSYNRMDILQPIREELTLDGKPYLYPSFCDGHVLLYRKSAAEKAFGGPLPEVVDPDTVISLASRLHGEDGMAGISMKAHESEIFLDFLPYLRSEGIDAFDEHTHEPCFYQEKGIKALEKYLSLKDLAPRHVHMYGNDEVRESFQKKQAALAITWGGQLGFVMDDRCLEKEDVGFAAISTAWNVTWGFAINKKSANKQLANEFLGYLSSPPIDRIVGSYSGAPVRESSYEENREDHPWYPVLHHSIREYARPLPKMEDAGERLAPLYTHIHKAFTGDLAPGDALKAAEDEILKINSREK
ncbi:extracellular solute-binding protein [Bacillus sp. REN3]|uniref:extracellular solute-binding protein n=1 Tax=Bacillus sp. REN3 TaxID=2802440 RepID=UPI001AEDABE3|nr:extracellular solute-binding protein [Bacillus sp. REN3]